MNRNRSNAAQPPSRDPAVANATNRVVARTPWTEYSGAERSANFMAVTRYACVVW